MNKTTTAEQLAASILYMDDPEKKEQNIAMSELNPKRLLKGAVPRLIDEWQLAPKLWDAIRSSDTRYFIDPSIAAAALGIGPNDLINDLKTFGFLFKTLCIRDLRVFADALNGGVYHYRDKEGQEPVITHIVVMMAYTLFPLVA